jgi:hypothetical protein
MKSRRLFLSIGVAVAMVAVFNLAILRSSRTSHRQRARAAIESVPATTQALFLGNSLMEAGCDMDAFTATWSRVGPPLAAVNLALGATTPVEHAVILDRVLQGAVRPKYIVYGFFDDQLNAPVQGDWSLLVGNRALSYYYPDTAAALYAPGSTLKRLELKFTQSVPMLAERSSLWTQVEFLRWKMEDIGMPKRATNRFGRVADFNALQAGDLASFNRRCCAIVAEKTGFSRPIQDLMQHARASGARFVLVEMPMPSKHRSVFYASPVWAEMRAHLQALAAEAGATYVVASDWIDDDAKFEDAAHLNEQGAKAFSARLAGAIARLETASLAAAGAP